MFENIKIIQNKDALLEGYWNFGWAFKHKEGKYANLTDNGIRGDDCISKLFGFINGISNRKLTCKIQIAMLESMLETMKRLNNIE